MLTGATLLGRPYEGERHAMPLSSLSAAGVDAIPAVTDCLYPLDERFASAALDFVLAADWREAISIMSRTARA